MSDALNYMVFDTNKLQIIKATIVSIKHSLCVNGIKLRCKELELQHSHVLNKLSLVRLIVDLLTKEQN